MTSQQGLEARYAHEAGGSSAIFLYAEQAADAMGRLGSLYSSGAHLDAIAVPGLRVAPVRDRARRSREEGRPLSVDVTIPSCFGLHALELGAAYQSEALNVAVAGGLSMPVVAIASRGMLGIASDALRCRDRAAIEEGLDSLPARMQRRFDHARALAEYLSCCEGLAAVSYPGLTAHPDHELATRTLRHGFGPVVEFELPSWREVTARDLIECCLLDDRAPEWCGAHTRLIAADGGEGRLIRIFAGLDDPLQIAAALDRALRALRPRRRP